MGNDILRGLAQPFHDCALYVCNSADSECESACFGSPCTCHVTTHEVDEEENLTEKERTHVLR